MNDSPLCFLFLSSAISERPTLKKKSSPRQDSSSECRPSSKGHANFSQARNPLFGRRFLCFFTWGTARKHALAQSSGSRRSSGLRSPFFGPGAPPPPKPLVSTPTATAMSEGDKEQDSSSSSAARAAGTAASSAWRLVKNGETKVNQTTFIPPATKGEVDNKRCG